MFRPVVAIIRFYHSTHLRLFYTIHVATCLMISQHQNPCWSIVPLYWLCGYYYVVHPTPNIAVLCSSRVFDVEISSSDTPPRELYRIILSESNDKT